MGRLRLFARLALVEAAVNLGLSLLLVGPLGLEGVAVAVAVPNVLFCLFVIAYGCRVLDVSAGQYLSAGWLRPACAAVVPAVVWWFVTPADPTWLSIGAGIAAGLVPYAAVVACVEFGPGWSRPGGGARTPRIAATQAST